jgi:TonB family protein
MAGLLAWLIAAAPAAAQNAAGLEKVRSLYVAAAYEEALAAMPAEASGVARRELEQYRALCLLALGREDEAVSAVERLVKNDPTYLPPDSDTSPRMRSIFADVRARVLPDIAREAYTDAKKAFDARDLARARAGFARAIELIDSLPESSRDSIGDLRVVAKGFIDLLGAQPAPKPAASPAAPPRLEPSLEYIGPVPLNEQLPAWMPPDSAARTREFIGLLLVEIGEDGRVRSATMVEPTHPVYDAAALRAARLWTYRPATIGGKPVPAQKEIRVRLVPR